jgi:Uma2 family endonuclease
MSAVTILELPGERQILYALTVGQYHQMVTEGILPEGEPFELIYGQVTRKDRSAAGADAMTVGDQHIWCVKRLAKLSRRLEALGCHMQTQQPVTLPPYNEPEPDGAIVIGSEDDYLDHKPGAADVTCVIEVADSSLKYDRVVKQRVYARSGILMYFIFNLQERLIEVYTEPLKTGRYRKSERLAPGATVSFPAPGGRRLSVPVRRLLP